MESCRSSAHDANEVVLPCLDGLLCQVAMVIIWQHKLECHVGCPYFLPLCRQDLIVKDLVFWYNPTLAIALRRANIISHSVLFFMVSIQVDIHQLCVGSSDINSPYSISGGTSLSGLCRKFPWVRRLARKHCAAFPLDAVLPHCDLC